MINRNLQIIFMGTPSFAVPSLEILSDAGYTIAAVITSPDKPGGRGLKEMMVSPVKAFAQSRNIPVLQPVNLKSKAFLSELALLNADLQVVVAFRMLPEVVWNMPHLGTMNLHGSLLPAYRGAAPIQWAIINGEKKTGVTTFMLQHKIDEGHILKQTEIPILDDDNAGSLHDRMMYAGAKLVIESVDLLQTNQAAPIPQDGSKASFAPKIDHDNANIKWDVPVLKVHNLIRGMSPYPGAWTQLDEKEWKIFQTVIYSDKSSAIPSQLRFENKKLIVKGIDGELEILEVQLAGKKKMNAVDFINGYQVKNWTLT